MKRTVKIIVGSNYGDEGKGLATNYFSSQANSIGNSCVNVLYNGGCQRGHTVETLDGFRHVFHHFGSGLNQGAVTYFDKDFMVNPMEFVRESRELGIKGCNTIPCYISYDCRVTTPFDMILNRIVEQSRGTRRHGSCGMGIWETKCRYISDPNSFVWGELTEMSTKNLAIYLEYIKHEYFLKRLKEYGIEKIPDEYEQIINSKSLIDHFITDFEEMEEQVISTENFYQEHTPEVMIFEGAQGLALDEDNVEEYPHVTASKTGAYIPMTRIPSDADVEICYITRSYFTRHGAGRLEGSLNVEDLNPAIKDFTNIHNEFQGDIRYAPFDSEALLKRVTDDVRRIAKDFNNDIKVSLFITHLNYTNGDVHGNGSIEELKGCFNELYLSYDRFGKDVRVLNKQ